MLPMLGQLITPTTDVTVDKGYEIAILDSDGSRRVIRSEHFETTSTVESVLRAYGPTPIVFWGPDSDPLHGDLAHASREGWYLPYPPASGIAIHTNRSPG